MVDCNQSIKHGQNHAQSHVIEQSINFMVVCMDDILVNGHQSG